MFFRETIADRSTRLPRANGFGAMRLFLAFGIVIFHGFVLSTGDGSAMPAPARAIADIILPAFFALSGYLVAASLWRVKSLPTFLALRLLRIFPALVIVVLATVFLLGPLLTTLPLREYFRAPDVPLYLYNMLGWSHFQLPGVFETNPRAGVVNGSIWTIPLELTCYALLGFLALVGQRRGTTLLLAALALLLMFPHTPFLGLLATWLPAKPLVLAFLCGALLFRLRAHVVLHPLAGMVGFALALGVWPHSIALAIPLLAYGVLWLSLRPVPGWMTHADYSYGFYLMAYPLQQTFIFLAPQAPWWGNLLFAIPAGLAGAALLWHGVESPILSRRHELVARLRGLSPVVAR